MKQQPLKGVRILDFSTLLPGPLCTLLCAEAGAEVIKIEKPGSGDEMRSYEPRFGDTSVNFALLNRGKKSVSLDLKQASGRDRAIEMVRSADVLVEQFRPGVMQRLGLGYEQLKDINPALIYCSITGYGQTGPLAQTAAHDLNYVAETGMLRLTEGPDGKPALPHALLADIGGGAYPAMMNILLALRARDSGGGGCHLDISMADNLFTFMYWGLGNGWAAEKWPIPGGDLVTGGTPRYQVYATSDGGHLAAAPLEQKFWRNFLDVLRAPHLLDDETDPEATRQAIAGIVACGTTAEWAERFTGVDACVSVARTLQDAIAQPHFASRNVFGASVSTAQGQRIPALPVPVVPAFRRDADGLFPPLEI